MDFMIHAGVFAVDVAVGGGRHGGVIERGGEDAALLVGAAFDFDLRELLVPGGACGGGHLLVRCGWGGFGFESGGGGGARRPPGCWFVAWGSRAPSWARAWPPQQKECQARSRTAPPLPKPTQT